MKRAIDWFIALTCLAGACWVMRAQDVTLCGTKHAHAYADLIHVGCVDYEELRRVAPSIPWPQGSSTQVLIHAKRGDVVAVTVDGETKHWPLTRDAWGRLVALVSFEGTAHTALTVKIGAWLE